MSSYECDLSASAHAFSSVLTAFIGSVINGLTSGALIALVTGWIAWLAVVRVLGAALFEYWQTFQTGQDFSIAENVAEYEMIPPSGGVEPTDDPTSSQMPKSTESVAMVDAATPYEPSRGQVMQQHEHPSLRQVYSQPGGLKSLSAARLGQVPANWLNRFIEKETSFLGWFGWAWSALYTPISQSIWVGVNLVSSDQQAGSVRIVRAIAIGVSALTLTYDNKQRYGAVLGRKLGSWAFVAFNLWNATMCLILGVECLVLLVTGAIQANVPVQFYPIYTVFSIIWAAVSFKFLPIINGKRRGVNLFVDLLVGAFAGAFVAAPAFTVWRGVVFDDTYGNQESGGLDLGEFLGCQGASGWAKFAAIMP